MLVPSCWESFGSESCAANRDSIPKAGRASIDSWTRRGVYSFPSTPRSQVDFLVNYFVVMFVGSASLIAVWAAIERRKKPPGRFS